MRKPLCNVSGRHSNSTSNSPKSDGAVGAWNSRGAIQSTFSMADNMLRSGDAGCTIRMYDKTPLRGRAGFQKWHAGLRGTRTCGVGSVPANYSTTSVIGKIALRALHRLASDQKRPLLSSNHFNATTLKLLETAASLLVNEPMDLLCKLQHLPMVASPEYFSYCYNQRDRLCVSPSIDDQMRYSAYNESCHRHVLPKFEQTYRWNDQRKATELTAAFYAIIEVEDWVGKLLKAWIKHG